MSVIYQCGTSKVGCVPITPYPALRPADGAACFAPQGRRVCYAAVYSLDATRCIILHLAATQSLMHASGGALGLWTAGAAVAVAEACLSQVLQAHLLGVALKSALKIKVSPRSRLVSALCGL